jgi:hypothetical protein
VIRVTTALCATAAGAALGLALATPASAQLTAAAAPSAVIQGGRVAPKAPVVHQSALVDPRKVTATSGTGPGAIPAANQDGACNLPSSTNPDGDFCLWFGANLVGSLSDFFNSDSNLSNNMYLTPGLGLGAPVANNSESAMDADSNLSVIVFTGTGFSGTGGVISPRQTGNFNTTFADNVESFEFS